MRSAPAVGGMVPTGNTFDKYGATNLVVKWLMAGFEGALAQLFDRADPSSVLDVGCGEGVLTERWARRLSTGRVTGIDLDDPKLAAEWATRRRANLRFETFGERAALPFGRDEFDLAAAIEVLEHVPDPEWTLGEMARVARGHLLVSVPREPLWRALNLARGAYARQFGNTPGHVSHFSKRSFASLVGRYGELLEIRSPFPWTMLLVSVQDSRS